MGKKQLYFLGGAVFIFILFTQLIPIYILQQLGIPFLLIGAAGAAVCTYFALKPDKKKMYTPENYESGKSRRTLAVVCSVIAAVATLLTIIISEGPREAAYIKRNSVIAKGVVTNGKAETTTRRGSTSTSYTLDVAFKVNGKTYNESVTVEGSDWNKAGTGMPVLVSYAKDHPDMCKILFNAEQARKYTNSDKIKPLRLDDFLNLYNKEGNSMLNELDQLSMGWGMDESEGGTKFCYNSVFKTSIVNTGNKLYLNETETSSSYTTLLGDARKNMQVVYDSLSTNAKKGAVFKNDSLQIRFQEYTELTTEENNEFDFPVMTYKKNYIVAATTQKGEMLLPGDVAPDPDDPAKMEELRKKAGKEALERLRNRQKYQ